MAINSWTFTLDGHDYYVLQLGSSSLVYDTHSEFWSEYTSEELDTWRPFCGMNWITAGTNREDYSSNIVCGDSIESAVYFLSPIAFVDDDPVSATTHTIPKEIYGQVLFDEYSSIPCDAVQLSGSVGRGSDPSLTDISLSVSDDGGVTYTSMGTVTVPNLEFDFWVEWRSLGSFSNPGRLFKFSDTGAIHRIDYAVLTTRDRRGR